MLRGILRQRHKHGEISDEAYDAALEDVEVVP